MFCPVMWVCSDTDERDRNSECGEVVSSPCMICVSNIPPAFLPHFPSDILLLTIFVTGWLRPCLMWGREGDQGKITSESRKLWQLFRSRRKGWLRKAATHLTQNDGQIFFGENLMHQYIVSRSKLSNYHGTEEEEEYRSLAGEPMSNHYFSV